MTDVHTSVFHDEYDPWLVVEIGQGSYLLNYISDILLQEEYLRVMGGDLIEETPCNWILA